MKRVVVISLSAYLSAATGVVFGSVVIFTNVNGSPLLPSRFYDGAPAQLTELSARRGR